MATDVRRSLRAAAVLAAVLSGCGDLDSLIDGGSGERCSGNTCGLGRACSADGFCRNACTDSAQCTGRDQGLTCLSGVCGGAFRTDGGMDAGTTDAGMMDAGVACTSTNTQPDVCGNGFFCAASNMRCASPAVLGCDNFPAMGAPRNWTPAGNSSPVIWRIEQVSFAMDSTFCGAGNPRRGRIRVSAYDTSSRLTSETGQPGLRYYRMGSDSSPLSVGMDIIQDYTPTNMNRNATFLVNFCAAASVTSLTVGMAYTGGNPYCFTLQ